MRTRKPNSLSAEAFLNITSAPEGFLSLEWVMKSALRGNMIRTAATRDNEGGVPLRRTLGFVTSFTQLVLCSGRTRARTRRRFAPCGRDGRERAEDAVSI